jgi:hypothetical protein
MVEDRAHQQVDQLRQELKTLRQERERAKRDYDKRVTQLTEQEHTLRESLRSVEQTAAHQAGRVAALEATIIQRQDTPAPVKRATRKTAKKGSVKSSRQARARPRA